MSIAISKSHCEELLCTENALTVRAYVVVCPYFACCEVMRNEHLMRDPLCCYYINLYSAVAILHDPFCAKADL